MKRKFTFPFLLIKTHESEDSREWGLAKLLNTSYSVIGKYERDEMLPSIEAAKKIAKLIDTTVGYLLGESNDTNVLRDTAMLKRLNDINSLPDKDKVCVLYTIDYLLTSVKTQAVYK